MKNIKNILKKITNFDKIVISVFVILLLVIFSFFYRKSEYVDIRVRVTDQDILYSLNNPQNWYANRFSKGDVERDILGKVMAEIKNVEIYSVDNFTKATYLDITVKATYDTRTKLYSARGKKLVFGTPVRFSLSGVSFDGVVTEPPNSEFHKDEVVSKRKINVLVRGVNEDGREFIEPQVLASLKVGDQINDSQGNTKAKIDKITLTPAERVVQDDKANLFLRYDPLYKDAHIVLEVVAKNRGGDSYIFNDFPLRLGSKVALAFGKTFVQAVIVGLDSQ